MSELGVGAGAVVAADAGAQEPAPGSSRAAEGEAGAEQAERADAEPPVKRRKLSAERTEKLELRLGGILCCAVCLDLPSAAVYQCTNGHLMCAACFTHLLADARLRDEAATCPNCRVEISKSSASRNLAVEKAVSELPSECKFCAQVFPRHSLERHEEKICEDRLSGCKYDCIGCPWRGPHHELTEHELSCLHPKKSGAEVVEFLATRDKQRLEEQALYNHVHELLSYEKITFSDLQLKPYRTDEFVNKLYYETSRFSAFNHQWVVKAYINHSQRDPTLSCDREITYQLILKTKSPCPLPVQYMALRGPYGEANIALRVHCHNFAAADDVTDAPQVPLPLTDSRETNRLLSNKIIHFRLIMFLTSK